MLSKFIINKYLFKINKFFIYLTYAFEICINIKYFLYAYIIYKTSILYVFQIMIF